MVVHICLTHYVMSCPAHTKSLHR